METQTLQQNGEFSTVEFSVFRDRVRGSLRCSLLRLERVVVASVVGAKVVRADFSCQATYRIGIDKAFRPRDFRRGAMAVCERKRAPEQMRVERVSIKGFSSSQQTPNLKYNEHHTSCSRI